MEQHGTSPHPSEESDSAPEDKPTHPDDKDCRSMQHKPKPCKAYVGGVPEGFCGICEKVFQVYTELEKHMKQHVLKSTFVCKQCNRHFLFEDKRARERDSDVCRGCTENRKLDIYFTIVSEDKGGNITGKCGKCYCDYVNEKVVTEHLWSHFEPQPFVCGFCGKSYARYSPYRAHMEKSFQRK